jgi:hypothetical protein
MRRYIVLLLITGIVWAQTDFYDYDLPYDEYFGELVLKDGTTYLGEYSKTEEKIVYFKHQDALAFQPVPVKLIQTLKLKDGTVLLHNGIIKKNKHTLGLGEYQKFSTKEKGIYDASVVVLGNKEKNYFPKSILTNSEKAIYKQAYSKKLHQRKSKSVAVTCIVTVVIVAVLGSSFSLSGLGGGGGMNCGPPCGSDMPE